MKTTKQLNGGGLQVGLIGKDVKPKVLLLIIKTAKQNSFKTGVNLFTKALLIHLNILGSIFFIAIKLIYKVCIQTDKSPIFS